MEKALHKAMGWAMPMAVNPITARNEDLLLRPLAHAVWLKEMAGAAPEDAVHDELRDAAVLTGFLPRSITLADTVFHIRNVDDGLLLIIPPTYADSWHRTGDDLDKAFETGGKGAVTVTYETANQSGFRGRWMDAEQHCELNIEAAKFMETTPPDLFHRWDEDAEADGYIVREMDAEDETARRIRPEHGGRALYGSAGEAMYRIVPLVPPEVRAVAEHLGLFEDPDDAYKLRPARVSWWV